MEQTYCHQTRTGSAFEQSAKFMSVWRKGLMLQQKAMLCGIAFYQ